MRLKLPNGRTYNTDGVVEPSRQDLYRQEAIQAYNKHAGVMPLPEFKKLIADLKTEYGVT